MDIDKFTRELIAKMNADLVAKGYVVIDPETGKIKFTEAGIRESRRLRQLNGW